MAANPSEEGKGQLTGMWHLCTAGRTGGRGERRSMDQLRRGTRNEKV